MKQKEIFAFLQNNYSPFIHLSASAMEEAQLAMRIFELRRGEEVMIYGDRSTDFLYLVRGTIRIVGEGRDDTLSNNNSTSRPYLMPREYGMLSIEALEDVVFCHADNEALDHLMSWDQLAQGGILDLDGNFTATMRKMRDSLALRRLPFEAVEEAFRRMKKVEVRTGDDVVKQGEPGDAFYLILDGQAEVWQQGIYDDEQKLVATLGPGDSFGEEALVLKGTRNATVRMSSKGRLLSLAKTDFEELVAAATIETVKPEVAKSMIDNGSKLLDVRYEEEYEDSYVPGSIHIPLPELRERIGELEPDKHYVLLCAGGKRASVANLLLRQRNFRAATIEGGIHDWPYDTASGY